MINVLSVTVILFVSVSLCAQTNSESDTRIRRSVDKLNENARRLLEAGSLEPALSDIGSAYRSAKNIDYKEGMAKAKDLQARYFKEVDRIAEAEIAEAEARSLRESLAKEQQETIAAQTQENNALIGTIRQQSSQLTAAQKDAQLARLSVELAKREKKITSDSLKIIQAEKERIERERRESELKAEAQRQELENQKLTRNFLIAIALFAMLNVGFVFNRYASKKKSEETLQAKNRELEDKQIELEQTISHLKTTQT